MSIKHLAAFFFFFLIFWYIISFLPVFSMFPRTWEKKIRRKLRKKQSIRRIKLKKIKKTCHFFWVKREIKKICHFFGVKLLFFWVNLQYVVHVWAIEWDRIQRLEKKSCRFFGVICKNKKTCHFFGVIIKNKKNSAIFLE